MAAWHDGRSARRAVSVCAWSRPDRSRARATRSPRPLGRSEPSRRTASRSLAKRRCESGGDSWKTTPKFSGVLPRPLFVRYLDTETVVALHHEIAGDEAGVRDRAGVESVLGRAEQSWEGRDLYPDVLSKAAAILHGFATTQHFLNGNKRTAFIIAAIFLEANGYRLDPIQSPYSDRPDAKTIESRIDARHTMIEAIAAGHFTVEEIARYLADHSVYVGI